jgi:hypothetical protein
MFVPFALALVLSAGPPDKTEAPKQVGVEVEVLCVDNSTIRLRVLDEHIELITRFGPLRIPVSQINRIELATRLPPELEVKIAAAVRNLGHTDFKTRDRAVTELKEFKERAYPALALATKSTDAEVARRAEELVIALQSRFPSSQLQPRESDVVHTDDCRITGKLSAPSVRVLTSQFGEQTLKLADAREIRTGAAAPPGPAAAVASGNMMAYQNQIGAEVQLQVTGALGGTVWGTDVYTLDSSVAAAAVHAGVVQPGQTVTVKVRILPSPPQYVGATRNGVVSTPYNLFPHGAFMFVR